MWTLNGGELPSDGILVSVVSLDLYETLSVLTVGPITPIVTGIYQCFALGSTFLQEPVNVSSSTSDLLFSCKHMHAKHMHAVHVTSMIFYCSTS